jgi:hypothetical protein
MSEWLTDTDRKCIEAFAEQPAYRRRPDMLVPRESDGDES